MSNKQKLTSADAVRLARFTYPQPYHHWEEATQITCSAVTGRGNSTFWFCLGDLNQLALAERRILEMRPWVLENYGDELFRQCDTGKWDLNAGWGICRAVFATATAEQRARALLSLLDAHPELEKPE